MQKWKFYVFSTFLMQKYEKKTPRTLYWRSTALPFFYLKIRSILTRVFQSEKLKCCISEMFFKSTFQSYACHFWKMLLFFSNFCKNGVTFKRTFFPNVKCFAERIPLSCTDSFISFLLIVKVQNLKFGKSHKLHSRETFVPIQQALEKCRVEVSMLFVGNQCFLHCLDVLLLLF